MDQLKKHTSQDLSGLRYRTRAYKSGIGLKDTSQDLSGLRYRTIAYKSGTGLEYTSQV